MDYGQHLVTMLVCFVKGEGGFGPRGFCQGGGSRLGGLCPTSAGFITSEYHIFIYSYISTL